ncbi:MAG: Stk1 family PASTA domain-containing Ser/Thr kinase [Halanaerobiaceae bacterium]
MQGEILSDRYKIIRELGKGGMAVVYEAQDLLLDRKVALKMLRPEYVSDSEFVKKFRHEAKAVARISHPNVVSIYDIGMEDEYHYLVMEDVEGSNLKDIIRERGRLTVVESLDIVSQICAALIVAHKNNIIHCDIKPHNILIDTENQVKVTDFGIARAATSSTVTMTETIVGSARYFSPEQARGGEVQHYSDIYSVGVVLYEMLTGRVPFEGDSPISVALKHIQKDPRRPTEFNSDIPEKVEKIVLKALAKEPEERYESAVAMREEISTVRQGLCISGEQEISDPDFAEGHTKVLDKSDLLLSGEEDKAEPQAGEISRGKIRNKLHSIGNLWRRLGRLRWVLISLIVFSGLAFGFYFFYQNYMDVPVVEVPDLVEMEYEKAERRAAEIGLSVERQDEDVYHSEVPEDHIISQVPEAGERIRQTRNITVTVSRGPQEITMPDLTGMTLREAEVTLDNEELEIAEREHEYNSEYEEDHVFDQEPSPDEELGSDDEIVLYISRGDQPRMVEMPNVIGLSLEEAEKNLEDADLSPGEIEREETKRFLEDQVFEQEHSQGEEIPEGEEVDLNVSSGLINSDDAETHTNTVRVEALEPGNQIIRIDVEDDNGRDTIYEDEHERGDVVREKINSVGSTLIEVYINDEKIWEREIN